MYYVRVKSTDKYLAISRMMRHKNERQTEHVHRVFTHGAIVAENIPDYVHTFDYNASAEHNAIHSYKLARILFLL